MGYHEHVVHYDTVLILLVHHSLIFWSRPARWKTLIIEIFNSSNVALLEGDLAINTA
jgi:hypothetical protein